MLTNKWLVSFFWTLSAFFIAIVGFDFFYDDSYDGLASNLSTGQFSDFSLFDWHFLGLIWLKDPLKYIQNQLTEIDVFYSFYVFCVLIGSLYLFYTFEKLASTSNWAFKLILRVSFLIFIVDSLIFITHTRFATLFTGLALLNLGLYHYQNKNQAIIHWFFFIVGFLVRPESGIGAIMFVIPGLFLVGISISKLLKTTLIPILCSLSFFIILFIYKKNTNRLEILIEPDIEYAMSTDKFIPLGMGQKEIDSVRYVFARNAFFIDTSFVDDKYLRSIISTRTEFDFISIQNSFRHITHYYFSYSILLFALLTILLIVWFSNQTQFFFKLLLYNLGIFIVLVLLDYQVNIADRHFSALMVLTILVSFLFIKKTITNGYLTAVKIISVLVFLFPIILTWNYIYQNDLYVKTKTDENNRSLDQFEDKIQGMNVFVTVSGFKLFDKPYSFFTSKRTRNHYYIYDLSTYSIVPRYADYLSRKCHCNATIPIEFFTWVSKTNGIIIIDEKRAEILSAYFKVKRHKKVVFYDAFNTSKILKKNSWPDLKFKRVKISEWE